jgi:hypothetical protein
VQLIMFCFTRMCCQSWFFPRMCYQLCLFPRMCYKSCRHILEKMIDRAFGKKHDYNVFWGKIRSQYILCKLVEDQHWHLAQKVSIRRIVYPLKYKCCIHKEGRMVYNNHSKMLHDFSNYLMI